MTLVDTTIWIDFFRGHDTPQVRELERIIRAGEGVCVCGVILTEVLQGIREDKDHANALECFGTFLFLPMTRTTFVRAADLYRALRRAGFTIRSAADCMIAAVAIENDVPLLHQDRDFDPLEAHCGLRVVKAGESPVRAPKGRNRPGRRD